MRQTKYGTIFTKEEKRQDVVKGIRKALAVGDYNKVMLLEKRLMTEYGMTADEIENEIYA